MIDLRQDAPDQSDVIDPEKLSEELEKLKSIQAQIQEAEKKLKDLKSDEKVNPVLSGYFMKVFTGFLNDKPSMVCFT